MPNYADGSILFDGQNRWLVHNTPWRPEPWKYFRVLIPDDDAYVSISQYRSRATFNVDADDLQSILQQTSLTHSSLTWAQARTLLLKYAPYIYLAQGEAYPPTYVEWFFQNSDLSYDNDNSLTLDATVLPLGAVNEESLPAQSYQKDSDSPVAYSHFVDDTYTASAFYMDCDYAENHQPVLLDPCNAPVYASVIDRQDAGGNQYRDLLYAFFYAYNDATGGDHQGDWEHVVVRLDSDGNVMAIYFQAHSHTDPYSLWYYPPDSRTGSHPGNSYQYYGTSTTRFLVFSARGGHGSYTRAGTFSYPSPRPSDTTSQGIPWDATTNLVVMDPSLQSWVLFSGSWGDPDWIATDTFGTPPTSPLAQQWLSPTIGATSPAYYTSVKVRWNPPGYSHQSSRVSTNFSVAGNTSIVWRIFDLPANIDLSNISFALLNDVTRGSDQLIAQGLTEGAVTDDLSKPNNLYIARLKYVDPHGNTHTDADVFTALNVTHFTIKADYQKEAIAPALG
jgi:hypothetical protein